MSNQRIGAIGRADGAIPTSRVTRRCLGEPTRGATRASSRLLEGVAKLLSLAFALALAFALLAAWAWAAAFAVATALARATARALDIGGGGVGLLRRARIPQGFAFAKSLFLVLIAIEALFRSHSTVRLMLLVAPVLGAFAILRGSGESVANQLALSLS